MIVRHSITQDLDRFTAAMDQLWGGRNSSSSIPLDLFEHDSTLVVRALVPGVNPSDLEITTEGGVLTISGEAKQSEISPDISIYRQELPTGKFSRALKLNGRFDLEAIQAKYEHGILTLRIPRQASELKRVIPIESN